MSITHDEGYPFSGYDGTDASFEALLDSGPPPEPGSDEEFDLLVNGPAGPPGKDRTMTDVITKARKEVDATTARTLKRSYRNLVKAGHDSVRAAWRFGQTLDSFSDKHTGYTQVQLADAMGLSTSTIYKYRKFYHSYQSPELAVAASEELETYDIGVLLALSDMSVPVTHGRPLAGRKWRFTCRTCTSHDIRREEIDPETGEPLDTGDDADAELDPALETARS